MKKQVGIKTFFMVAVVLMMGLVNGVYGYDVALRNDTPYKVEMTVHNRGFLGTCKDIKKELQPNPGVVTARGGGEDVVCKDKACYYKESNGICNVKRVTAKLSKSLVGKS